MTQAGICLHEKKELNKILFPELYYKQSVEKPF